MFGLQADHAEPGEPIAMRWPAVPFSPRPITSARCPQDSRLTARRLLTGVVRNGRSNRREMIMLRTTNPSRVPELRWLLGMCLAITMSGCAAEYGEEGVTNEVGEPIITGYTDVGDEIFMVME